MLCFHMQKSQLVPSASKNLKFTAILVNTVARNHQMSWSKGRKMQNKSWTAELSGISTPHFCCCLKSVSCQTLQSKSSHILLSQVWFANSDCFQQNKTSQRHWKKWKELSCIFFGWLVRSAIKAVVDSASFHLIHHVTTSKVSRNKVLTFK